MKIIFAGTPEFATIALKKIVEAGHEIVLVLTQPDRPSGRGLKLTASAVKEYAIEKALRVEQPMSLKLDGKYPEDAKKIQDLMLELKKEHGNLVTVVAAYGLIIPQWYLDVSRTMNIHGSLLPRWQGAAPIQRAIEAGDDFTGITIMEVDVGLDTGDMLLSEAISIGRSDNAQTIHDKLAQLGGKLVLETLKDFHYLWENKVKQPTEGVTYAHKVTKEDGYLDLKLSATVLERKIRAFNSSLDLDGVKIKILKAEVVDDIASEGIPGKVFSADKNGLIMECGSGCLRLLELQKIGRKPMGFRDFINGHNLMGKIFK